MTASMNTLDSAIGATQVIRPNVAVRRRSGRCACVRPLQKAAHAYSEKISHTRVRKLPLHPPVLASTRLRARMLTKALPRPRPNDLEDDRGYLDLELTV